MGLNDDVETPSSRAMASSTSFNDFSMHISQEGMKLMHAVCVGGRRKEDNLGFRKFVPTRCRSGYPISNFV